MIDDVCDGLQYIYIPMQTMASVDPNHDTLFVFSSSNDKSSGGYKNEACILKKNQNTPRPSEHPPVSFFFSKRLGGIKAANTKPLHGI